MSQFILLFILTVVSQQLTAQTAVVTRVSVSGSVNDKTTGTVLAYVNVVLKRSSDSAFVSGAITNETGRFTLSDVLPGEYLLEASFLGYQSKPRSLFVGNLSPHLEIPPLEMEEEETSTLEEITITAKQTSVNSSMDKKTYNLSDNVSQSGGSVLQTMQNLPGVSVQEGKIQLRGSDKITVLIDGKQTALTGFGSQSGLDNIPASAIEKIEIINNPSSKYDANGNAGIINIVMKQNKQEGWHGKIALSGGLGALWERRTNLPTIGSQYQCTPKINPSLALHYTKKKMNVFLQVDNLYTETLNKNEFVTRVYDEGTVINSQLKRNRNTNFFNSKIGMDWSMNAANSLNISALFGSEKILDRGDQPFFKDGNRVRLWQFLEDELKTTVMALVSYRHQFKQPGHLLQAGFNYTFHRENEKYFYDNYLQSSVGTDAFKLLSDEQVYDLNLDYIRPLKYGRIETGLKLRNRNIPTNMQFLPGVNSVLDSSAGGWATYQELIPAVYGTYVFETKKWEAELGLRMEYVRIRYEVNPGHNTYRSDGYEYTQPFPNFRLAYKLNHHHKLSVFYNRRVDRPNEVDIRIFPKYDDAEIIKVGNPALKPQLTQSLELGYRSSWSKGSWYIAAYYRRTDGTITRIASILPGSTLIYAIFQNAGKSDQWGLESIWEQNVSSVYSFNFSGNLYLNRIDAFMVMNRYPQLHEFSADRQYLVSGNLKLNNSFHFTKGYDAQLSLIYLAPDIIPQGRLNARFTINIGIKKSIQKGKGEIFFNATDLLNSLVTNKQIQGNGFHYTSIDYYETQVIRFGYSYKF